MQPHKLIGAKFTQYIPHFKTSSLLKTSIEKNMKTDQITINFKALNLNCLCQKFRHVKTVF